MSKLKRVRKSPLTLLAISLLALPLAACAGGPLEVSAASCTPGTQDTELAKVVSVSGALGTAPTLDASLPLNAPDPGFVALESGEDDGVRVTAMSQMAQTDVTLFAGTTGELITSTSYAPDLQPLSQWTSIMPGLEEAFSCVTAGTRLLAVLPLSSLEESMSQSLASFNLSPDDSVVAVVDIAKLYPATATGPLVYNDGFGLPSVVRADDGTPGAVIPDTEAPSELVSQTLIAGEGDEVTEGDNLMLNYTGWVWSSKEIFDSSWQSGRAAIFPLANVVEGFREGLVGKKVGSQVMLVIPPGLGYGDADQGSIPANSTLVFVVDILGTVDDAEMPATAVPQ